MFDIPEAKRVRRDDLYNDNSSESDRTHDEAEDAGIRAKLNERLSHMISLDLTTPQQIDDPEPMEEDEPELEFRLFATSAPTVVRPEEDDVQGDGGILAARPLEFYLRDFKPEERARFREVAVSYEDVLRMARQRAWGLEVPWRVKAIKLKAAQPAQKSSGTVQSSKTSKSKSKAVVELVQEEEEGSKKRKRPGKKRRILLRTKEKEKAEKERIRKEKQEAMEKSKLSKEEHLREKKKRLNREKKLKRRQKEKEKKMAAGGGAGSVGGGGGEESDSDGSE